MSSAQYAADFNEVKTVGGKDGAKRTPDRRITPRSGTSSQTSAGTASRASWRAIMRQDLWQRARTFALLNVALADSYIAGWDSKFHYNFWRPVTAIRLADADGNPQTAPDASFEPLLTTPPVQDYPSTHSVLGAAAATVLADAFGGSDPVHVGLDQRYVANPTREFRSFSEAARENADSRVKAGLHFRFATTAGLKLGENIGRFAVRNNLTPLD